MTQQLAWLIPAFIAAAAFAQQATIRVEVTADSAPVQGADVSINGKAVRTGQDGSATTAVPAGDLKIIVTKEGYFPANAALRAEADRESHLRIELQPNNAVEEQIKVYATRNDVRIQDSPLHVE